MPAGQFMAEPIHDAQRQFMARTEIRPLCGPFLSSAAGGYIALRSGISNTARYISHSQREYIAANQPCG